MNKFRFLLVVILSFFFANSFAQTIIPVAAGTDGIKDAYTSATAGDIIELTTSGGLYTETTQLQVLADKPITIRSAAGLTEKPIWVCSAVSATGGILTAYGSVTLDGLILDGKGGNPATATTNAIITSGTSGTYNVKILNSTIKNFATAVYGSGSAAQIDTLKIDNCMLENLTDNAIIYYAGSTAPGSFKCLSITNSTFWNPVYRAFACLYSMANDALYSPKVGWTPDPRVEIDHITVYNFRRLYCKEHSNVLIKNSIFAIPTVTSSTGFLLFGDQSTISNCMYYNVSNSFTDGVNQNNLMNSDPLFVNASAGDFSIPVNSPAHNAGTDGKTLGDKRWWPDNGLPSNIIDVAAGVNTLSQALASATAGQTLSLITNGGVYEETSTLNVDKNINIIAADGLSIKPTITSGSTNAMIEVSADLLLQGVILDGGSALTAKGIINKPGTSGYDLRVLKTDFYNFKNTEGTVGYGIYGDPSSVIDTVFVQDCSFGHILNVGINFKTPSTPTGSVNHFFVDNSTFWDMSAEAIYVDGADGSVATKDPQFSVNKVTVFNCGAYNIIAHYIDSASISNSMVVLPTLNISYAPTKIYGTNSKVTNFLYFNTRAIDLSGGATTAQLTNVINADPIFRNAGGGDFTIIPGSPAYTAGTDGKPLGDSRWWGTEPPPAPTYPNNIHWGTVNNTLNGLTITWNDIATDDSLRWGYTDTFEKGSFPGVRRDNYKITTDAQYLFDYQFPTVTPSTKLYYSIKSNGTWGATKTFTTSVDTASNKFTFVTGADCQASTTNFRDISNLAAAEKADFYLMVGDIIDNGIEPSLWKQFYDNGTDYLANTLNFYTHGNHVYYDNASAAATLNQLVLPGNEKWYSFKQGNTLFLCLLSEDDLAAQYTYAKDVLKNTDATWIVVYFHRPFFTSSDHKGEMDPMLPFWWKLFDDYGVDVIINGHVHTYTRSNPMNLNVSTSSPVNEYGCGLGQGRMQMLAGSFGAPRYNLETGWWVNTTKSVFNYVRFKVDGNSMHFDAIDINNKIIDSLTMFSDGIRQPSNIPGFYFLAPGTVDEIANFNYKIQWTDSVEPTDSANAKVSLYFTSDTSQAGTLIEDNIKINDPKNFSIWNVVNLTPATYYIYAVITNGAMTPIKKFAVGRIIVQADSIAPPPVTELTGTSTNGMINLTWVNPTREKYFERILGTFETGVDDFIGSNSGGSGTSTGSLVQVDGGYSGKGLQINYNIAAAWDQYAAVKTITGYPDYYSTPNLEFWYKGDGSSRKLRIIVKQDNDRNGSAEDWWFNESLSLSSTSWTHASLKLSTFEALSWHGNSKTVFDLTNMAEVDFIIPSGTVASGSAIIDEIKVSGSAPPAPDFKEVVVLRKDDNFPANPHDGVVVYQGSGESCSDSTTDHSKSYYYAAFASDYAGNFSGLDSTSTWISSPITGVHDIKNRIGYNLDQNYPNPFNPATTIKFSIAEAGMVNLNVYNIIGQKIATLVNKEMKPGYYSVEFNANNYPSGIYIFRLQSGNFNSTRKMILMK